MNVPDDLAGSRADRVVAALHDVSVNAARRLIEAGRVRVDGRRVKKGDAVAAGRDVVVEGHGAWLVPGPGDGVPVVYEDARVVVVNKPAGIPCHPLVPGEGGTVVDALVARYPEIASASDDAREGGLVHRLDTGTSGCLAVARSRDAWKEFESAFTVDDVLKRYLAVVDGVVRARLVCESPIGHDPKDARRMVVDDDGRSARTEAVPIAVSETHSLVDVRAFGGRRHQIRVHLASAGHPLLGDVLYGGSAGNPWHLLHASSLALPGLPEITAPVPSPFVEAANLRGLKVPGGAI